VTDKGRMESGLRTMYEVTDFRGKDKKKQ